MDYIYGDPKVIELLLGMETIIVSCVSGIVGTEKNRYRRKKLPAR